MGLYRTTQVQEKNNSLKQALFGGKREEKLKLIASAPFSCLGKSWVQYIKRFAQEGLHPEP